MHPTPDVHSPRYFALLYSPAPERAVLEALFGIEHEVSESLKPGLDHHVAHARLQWWREECERAEKGQPVHPMTRALTTAIRTSGIENPLSGLAGFVDVAVWDLAGATFETRRELTAYCERWAMAMIESLVGGAVGGGAVNAGVTGAGAMTVDPMGSGVPHTSAIVPPDAVAVSSAGNWRALGAAIREIELLTHLAREAHRGRLRLPLDELDRIHAEPNTLATLPWTDAVADLIRARHEQLRAELNRALGNVSREQQPALRGLMVWTALAVRMSQRAQSALPRCYRPRRLDAISDAWFAWRVARRATIGRLSPN